jgi:hypothetical protein
MTPEQKTLQDMRRDLLYIMANPMQRCKVCLYRDRDCDKEGGCVPAWRGDHPETKPYGGKSNGAG